MDFKNTLRSYTDGMERKTYTATIDQLHKLSVPGNHRVRLLREAKQSALIIAWAFDSMVPASSSFSSWTLETEYEPFNVLTNSPLYYANPTQVRAGYPASTSP